MAPKKKRKPSAYNRHVGREMRRGLTMAQAAKSWKKKAKPSRKRVVRKAPKRKSRKMAKKRTYRRKNGFSQAKMFSLVRKLALVAPAIGVALGEGSGPKDKFDRGVLAYTGFNMATQKFDGMAPLKNTYTPFLAATLITAGIPKIAAFVKGVI